MNNQIARLVFMVGTLALLPAPDRLPKAAAAQQTRPNIILIIADDLSWGDLGCYGQKQILTPNIDRLAREGMRFTNAYAGNSVCAPSRSCLMQGLHPGHARVRGNAYRSYREGLAKDDGNSPRRGLLDRAVRKMGTRPDGTARSDSQSTGF